MKSSWSSAAESRSPSGADSTGSGAGALEAPADTEPETITAEQFLKDQADAAKKTRGPRAADEIPEMRVQLRRAAGDVEGADAPRRQHGENLVDRGSDGGKPDHQAIGFDHTAVSIE
jgi:hypothetical protein